MPLLAPLALGSLLLAPGGAPPGEGEAELPARVESLVGLVEDPGDIAGEAAFGWLRFIAAGYRGSADLLGHGKSADAELALGEAIEQAARAALEAQVGKKGKVKLSDAAEGPVTAVDDAGVTVTINKADTLVAWAEVDPKQVGLLISKGKPTEPGPIAAAAALKLLAGDAVDARQRAAKLGGELGSKLGELLEDMKEVGAPLQAARALDGALRERDDAKAIARFAAAWGAAKGTTLGAEAKALLREQFVVRGTSAFAGDKALDAAFRGKVTRNPSKLHPDAGPGGMGLVIEYDFEKDSEARDFDPARVPAALLGMVRMGPGQKAVASPFRIDQSRLAQDGDAFCAGALPLEFCADVELEIQGGIWGRFPGGPLGSIVCGVATADGSEWIFMHNFSIVERAVGGKNEEPWKKPIEKLAAETQWATTLRLAGGKATFTRLPDNSPALPFATSASLRPFVMVAGPPSWFCERLVIKGTATGASLGALARVVAEREAEALFGE